MRIMKQMSGLVVMLFLGLCMSIHAGEDNVLFYLPLDGDLIGKTPETEVEPSSGIIQVDDWSQSVTMGEIGDGPKLETVMGGEKMGRAVNDPRVSFEKGIRGKAARLTTTVTYPAKWLKDRDKGTITVWYKNPKWRVQTWNVPAMVTPAQPGRAKPSAFQTPLSWWIFNRMTSPPEQGDSKWYHWRLDFFGEHPRNMSPRARDDDKWHFWALRWDKEKGLLEVIDDGKVRDISKYDNMLEPGKDFWVETYRGNVSEVYEDVGHIKFEEIFLGEIHLGRFCEVSLDEIYVFDDVKSRDELIAAYKRGEKDGNTWPSVVLPKPKRKVSDGLDLTKMEQARPDLPEQVKWDAAGAYIQDTGLTKSTCLNGYWRFQPTDDRLIAPAAGTWDYMRIPGDWSGKVRKGGVQRLFNDKFEVVKDRSWAGKPLGDFKAFWFERDIDIPAAEKGNRFFVRCDRFDEKMTLMDLYVNGKYVRQLRTYGTGYADITDCVKPGEKNRIAFAVSGKTRFLHNMFLDSCKLNTVSLHDVYVVPKYRDKSVEVRFDLENHTDRPQTYTFAADFFESESGKKVHGIPGKTLTIGPDRRSTVAVKGKWDNPRLWSIYDPFLHTAQVVVKNKSGKELDRTVPVRFGYRELWSEGGWLYMNGARMHVRGIGHGAGLHTYAVDSALAEFGVTRWLSIMRRVNDYWNRDWRPEVHAYLKTADEMGGTVSIKLPASGYKATSLYAGNPEKQAKTLAALKCFRNHPSFTAVILRQSGNYAQKNSLNAPFWEDRMREDASWDKFREVWDEYAAPLKEACPTAMFTGMWAPYGDGMGNFGGKHGYGLALQSREEIGREYGRYEIARVNAECGWPQISRNAWDVTGVDDLTKYYKMYWPNLNQITEELSAMYFGDEAYDQQAAVTNSMGYTWLPVEGNVARFDWDYVNTIQTVGIPFSRKAPRPKASPGWFKVRYMFADRNIRGWRWTGLGYWTHTEHNQNLNTRPTAYCEDTNLWAEIYNRGIRSPGILVDDGRPNRYRAYADQATFKTNLSLSTIGKIVTKQQQPVVAWIMGWPDPLRKDHAYYSGSLVRKHIGVMCEYPCPTDVTMNWRLENTATEKVFKEGTVTTRFENGDRRLFPVSFNAPVVKSRTPYRFVLETSCGGEKVHDDVFDIEVFPEHELSPVAGKIALVDSGATDAVLEHAGIAFVKVTDETDLSKFDLLVIGRKADRKETAKMLKKLDLKKHMANGLNVLIFEQEGHVLHRPDPDPWPRLTLKKRSDRPELTSSGLRQERLSCRYLFIRDPDHQLFEGLTNEDLRNWRGASNLIAPWSNETWMRPVIGYSRQWREPNMSNMGDLATYVFEKPQSGNFISLLDASFDMLYTALLEERRANAKTIYCQVNLGNRYGVDPVATILLDRLVKYALEKPENQVARAAFLGSKACRKTIDKLHFDLPDLDASKGVGALDGISTLVVGIGTPRIEDFDKENKFVGVKAAPAQPGKDKTLDWLTANREAIAKFVAEGGNVLVLPVMQESELSWLPFKVGLKNEKFFAAETGDFFDGFSVIGPSDLYYRRTAEIPVLSELPKGSRTTAPAVMARVPWKKGEFIFAQIHPRTFYGNWPMTKNLRVLSAILTEKGVADAADIDLIADGYGKDGFPYCARTLYFDPFLSTSW